MTVPVWFYRLPGELPQYISATPLIKNEADVRVWLRKQYNYKRLPTGCEVWCENTGIYREYPNTEVAAFIAALKCMSCPYTVIGREEITVTIGHTNFRFDAEGSFTWCTTGGPSEYYDVYRESD